MNLEPFIVQLSVPVDEFRGTLAAAPIDTRFVRALSRGQVVVLVPAGHRRTLRALPGVTVVTPDTLQHKLSARTTAG